MRKAMTQQVRPALKTLVAETARSLAKLDAERLEELALSCQSLNGAVAPGEQHLILREARNAEQDMAMLAKVLEATRANVGVMSRLRELHASRMEYSVGQQAKMSATEVPDGLH
jgi:hypothetical protein